MHKTICLSLIFVSQLVFAEQTEGDTAGKSITTIKVEGSIENNALPTGSMPSIYKNKIFTGKKATTTNNMDAVTKPEANNLRQVMQESSGVIVTEVMNQSYQSIAIRGVGDPHESQSILILSDDVPLAADLYGYPAAYYAPSLSSVESVEVTKTGAGLLYGSQPGGSINYRLKSPQYNSVVQFKTQNNFGSNQLFTTFNSVQGGTENLAYRVEGYQKTGEGQFNDNSDFNAYGFDSRIRYKINENQELKNHLSFYKGKFAEPGGLALNPGAGVASIQEDRKVNTIKYDELIVDRIEARIAHEYKSSEKTQLTTSVWGSNTSRESHRQNGSGFGVISTTNSNTIQDQDFYTTGAKAEVLHDYQISDTEHTLTANVSYYSLKSPFEQGTGTTADAEEIGTITRQIDRKTVATALAIENQFNLGRWTVVPSVRVENINSAIDEKYNGTGSLRTTDEKETVTLSGLAVAFDTLADKTIYFTVAEGFRPIQFTEAVPTSSNTVVNNDLDSSKTLAAELGVKGQFGEVDFDASIFSINYKNQIGTVTGVTNVTLGNVGEGQYDGIDLSARTKINTNTQAFMNSQFLSAKFKSGPLKDKTPSHAAHYMHKLGLEHGTDQFKNRIAASFLAEHYSDDNNTSDRKIPSYNVWDFSGEYSPKTKIFNADTKLNYGINNVFDNKYYARVRATGIEPALERNFYAGFELAY